MPKWRKLCKNGEVPSKSIYGKEFEDIFGIQTWRHPNQGVDRHNCCYSHIPEEWSLAVSILVDNVRNKYKLVGLDGNLEDKEIRIDQIKDKFGSLQVYYTVLVSDEKICNEIYKFMHNKIRECEKNLTKIDEHYGVPY